MPGRVQSKAPLSRALKKLKTRNLKLQTQLYSAIFKDHLANPRNAGELADANAVAEETNPVCGDRLRLSLRVIDGRIEAARFLAYGCPPTLVCGSVLTELIQDKTIRETMQLKRKDLLDALGGLPSRKQHAAALAIETLQAAIESGCGELLNG
jgi:NifU-like protein involved in Fe-S cluster formation